MPAKKPSLNHVVAAALVALLSLSPLLSVKADASVEFGADAVSQLEVILQDGVNVSVEVLEERHGMPSRFMVPIAGVARTIEVSRHSACSDDYKLLVQDELGVLNEQVPGESKTFRGSIVGIPGSSVGGGMVEDRILARIQIPGSGDYWLEPLDNLVDGVSTSDYILYRLDDTVAGATGALGTTAAFGSAATVGGVAAAGTAVAAQLGSSGPRILHLAEVAVDSDVEFFQKRGSVAAAEQLITALINAANVQFERDAQIRNVISGIIIRTAEPDPYSPLHNTVFFFRTIETAIQASGLPFDFGLFFSPLRMGPGGSAGLASGTLCASTRGRWPIAWINPDHRPVIRSPITIPFSMQMTLTAHEMGHLWGAGHNAFDTMASGISTDLFFEPLVTVPSIVAMRDSPTVRACTDLKDLGEEVNLVSMSVTNGSLSAGSVADLDIADDSRVSVRAAALGSKFASELTLEMASPYTAASRLNITVESNFMVPGMTAVARTFVELWDFAGARWRRIDRFAPSPNAEEVVEILIDTKASDYIDSTTGAVRLRLRTEFGSHGFFSLGVDHIDIGIWP